MELRVLLQLLVVILVINKLIYRKRSINQRNRKHLGLFGFSEQSIAGGIMTENVF